MPCRYCTHPLGHTRRALRGTLVVSSSVEMLSQKAVSQLRSSGFLLAPIQTNSHPHFSDDGHEFTVIHNGIITNYKELKTFLEEKVCKGLLCLSSANIFCVSEPTLSSAGCSILTHSCCNHLQGSIFITDTDTEVIAKLIKYLWEQERVGGRCSGTLPEMWGSPLLFMLSIALLLFPLFPSWKGIIQPS